tara:strand:- start:817 stop:1185 length:369 start_codon:yes stop_codon:yes gene_type:complete
MSSFSVALPLTKDSTDGFRMNKSLKSLTRQNLKMLILTNPGERVMEPTFGAGIRTILFENFNTGVQAEIARRIREQVQIYMPAIKINAINFDATNQDRNILGIVINYSIPKIGMTDLLKFTI